MKKDSEHSVLQREALKKVPFSVPEGYFENFPGRLKARIGSLEQDQVPARKPGTRYLYRFAMAAAIIGLALITWSLIRTWSPAGRDTSGYPEIAVLDEAGIFSDEYELASYLENGETPMDEEEAFIAQAMDYLAMNMTDTDLMFK
jgi:hypothetical protein